MTIERLEELKRKVFCKLDNNDIADFITLIDSEIERQSVTDDNVKRAIEAIWLLQQLRNCSNLNAVYIEPIKLAITALKQYRKPTEALIDEIQKANSIISDIEAWCNKTIYGEDEAEDDGIRFAQGRILQIIQQMKGSGHDDRPMGT